MQELITLQISLIKQKTSLAGDWVRNDQLPMGGFKCFGILFARKYLLRSNTPRMAARSHLCGAQEGVHGAGSTPTTSSCRFPRYVLFIPNVPLVALKMRVQRNWSLPKLSPPSPSFPIRSGSIKTRILGSAAHELGHLLGNPAAEKGGTRLRGCAPRGRPRCCRPHRGRLPPLHRCRRDAGLGRRHHPGGERGHCPSVWWEVAVGEHPQREPGVLRGRRAAAGSTPARRGRAGLVGCRGSAWLC